MGKIIFTKSYYTDYNRYCCLVDYDCKGSSIFGKGVEVTIDRPIVEYFYNYDYPKDGWDSLLNAPKYIDQYGNSNGVGADETYTSPMFNMHYISQKFRNLHATTECKILSPKVLAIAWLDSQYMFGSVPLASSNMSDDAENIAKKISDYGLFNLPKKITKNNRDDINWDNFILEVDMKESLEIPVWEKYWIDNRLREEGYNWRDSLTQLGATDNINYRPQ